MSDRPDLPTAEQCDQIFHAALREGGARGVEAALRVMVAVDPRRAVELYDELKIALRIADWIGGGSR